MNEPIPLRLAKKGDRISFVKWLDKDFKTFKVLPEEYIVTDEECHIEEEGCCRLVKCVDGNNKKVWGSDGLWVYREKGVVVKNEII